MKRDDFQFNDRNNGPDGPHAMKPTRPFDPISVITIDGPTASGKGTVAALVAATLGFHLLDSGALYRLPPPARPPHTHHNCGA
ncbi:hypothetical protein BurMR1_2773, partial [Burkholderia sp. MR1]